MPKPIRVLIVDDSPTVRTMLAKSISNAPDIEVVGEAPDPFQARELIIQQRPEVIILDIEMPRMDGLTFLKKLQEHYPVPVIMCSGVASESSKAALQAIELGAVDFVAKPSGGGKEALMLLGEDLAFKIRAATVAVPARAVTPSVPLAIQRTCKAAGIDSSRFVVAIGSSTGGTEALKKVLENVPADFPPVAIVQHMPPGFTKTFADRLNDYSPMTVSEAVNGDLLVPGRAFVARGGVQMSIERSGGRLKIKTGSSELVNRHCPAADVLFDSVADLVGKNAVGVILTGMGADGAQGLLKMRESGAITVGQNRESCVVYGMPKVAAEIGAVQHVTTPENVGNVVISALKKIATPATAR
ncbi:MAG TPA: chemotaxis response regulator protein-glutamate methylesterase [Phycisphaerae bacterium]|nr:chemotaxis response regulator protein-glutamate methylesterase [Phycisphaerae bacterium]